MSGIIVIMCIYEADKWAHLITRLETLRAVGGVPAIRYELCQYDEMTLYYVKLAAIETVLTTGISMPEQNSAFEIAATISDVLEHRKD